VSIIGRLIYMSISLKRCTSTSMNTYLSTSMCMSTKTKGQYIPMCTSININTLTNIPM
jgi:hypothetical protein